MTADVIAVVSDAVRDEVRGDVSDAVSSVAVCPVETPPIP